MRIVQIAPEIGPGSGVAGVAFELERAWLRDGIEVERFTMTEARGDWLPRGGPGPVGKLSHAVRVVWFSTVGSVLARRFLRRHPDLLSICHNDALAGDVYVNHGILQAAMRARGQYLRRMVRNPLHLFTTVRDRLRYSPQGPHRLVVTLTEEDDRLLRQTYPRLATPTRVIGNGVSLDTYVPPGPAERDQARRELSLAADDTAVLFVGHEFDRKGLPVLFESLTALPDSFKLLVVGGSPDMIRDARARAQRVGLRDRVQFTGEVSDPLPCYHASDVFALPSAYETGPLVLLEALACGIPVVSTPTGLVPALVTDAVNGFVVPADAALVGGAIQRLAGMDRSALGRAARESVLTRSWGHIAAEYLAACSDAHREGRRKDHER